MWFACGFRYVYGLAMCCLVCLVVGTLFCGYYTFSLPSGFVLLVLIWDESILCFVLEDLIGG